MAVTNYVAKLILEADTGRAIGMAKKDLAKLRDQFAEAESDLTRLVSSLNAKYDLDVPLNFDASEVRGGLEEVKRMVNAAFADSGMNFGQRMASMEPLMRQLTKLSALNEKSEASARRLASAYDAGNFGAQNIQKAQKALDALTSSAGSAEQEFRDLMAQFTQRYNLEIPLDLDPASVEGDLDALKARLREAFKDGGMNFGQQMAALKALLGPLQNIVDLNRQAAGAADGLKKAYGDAADGLTPAEKKVIEITERIKALTGLEIEPFDVGNLDAAHARIRALIEQIQKLAAKDASPDTKIDTANMERALASLRQLIGALDGASAAQKKLAGASGQTADEITADAQRAAQSMVQVEAAQRKAQQQMLKTSLSSQNLVRIVQDLPFGMMGITNNIQALSESITHMMGNINEATGKTYTFGEAMKQTVRGALMGPMAFAMVVAVVSNLILRFDELKDMVQRVGFEFGWLARTAEASAKDIQKAFEGVAGDLADEMSIDELRVAWEASITDIEAAQQRLVDSIDNVDSVAGAKFTRLMAKLSANPDEFGGGGITSWLNKTFYEAGQASDEAAEHLQTFIDRSEALRDELVKAEAYEFAASVAYAAEETREAQQKAMGLTDALEELGDMAEDAGAEGLDALQGALRESEITYKRSTRDIEEIFDEHYATLSRMRDHFLAENEGAAAQAAQDDIDALEEAAAIARLAAAQQKLRDDEQARQDERDRQERAAKAAQRAGDAARRRAEQEGKRNRDQQNKLTAQAISMEIEAMEEGINRVLATIREKYRKMTVEAGEAGRQHGRFVAAMVAAQAAEQRRAMVEHHIKEAGERRAFEQTRLTVQQHQSSARIEAIQAEMDVVESALTDGYRDANHIIGAADDQRRLAAEQSWSQMERLYELRFAMQDEDEARARAQERRAMQEYVAIVTRNQAIIDAEEKLTNEQIQEEQRLEAAYDESIAVREATVARRIAVEQAETAAYRAEAREQVEIALAKRRAIREAEDEITRDAQDAFLDRLFAHADNNEKLREAIRQETSILAEQEAFEWEQQRQRLEAMGVGQDAIEMAAQAHRDRLATIERDGAQALAQIRREEFDAALSAGRDLVSSLAGLSDTLYQTWRQNREQELTELGVSEEERATILEREGKKRFAIKKALLIADAIGNTLAAGVEAYRAGVEIGGPVGLAVGGAMMATALATGFAQVQQIRNLTPDGGGASASAGAGQSYGGAFTVLSANATASRVADFEANGGNLRGGFDVQRFEQAVDRFEQSAQNLQISDRAAEDAVIRGTSRRDNLTR